MLLSKVLKHIEKQGISYSLTNFVDIEISHISVPSESDTHSILFFSRGSPDDLCFDYGACLVRNGEPLVKRKLKNVIQVENPRLAVIIIGNLFKPYFSQRKSSISNKAVIHPEAKIGKNVVIMDNAVLGKCIIGDYTVIYPNVVIYDDVQIGSFCEINANATLGAEGMGSERYPGGKIVRFPHFSSLIIKDNVFIGPNAIIARGVLTPTTIESGCMIDAFTHIGHNSHIGEGVEIIAGAAVCGSVKIGKHCFVGANSTIRDGVTIADNTTVGMGAVVAESFLEPGIILAGVPARILKR